ncbi:hypothetical protein P280DRAFT_396548 [Massarina eburnea CBS 473.64]|uniref:laccase n=1 Tax=Massarina eburnea CBS 473.64 TaxID=1395130 RepID=A0A6A6S4R7_9PLEO|nr:hypothetical protein P280DRAFT_396548 [Massarina eburnea CBS 473.64]
MGRPSTLAKRATTTSATSTSTSKVADAACTNGPYTRTCWSSGFSAATDFDAKWPVTGKTVSYSFELVNSTCDPDGSGSSRPCQLFNGQLPGPTVRANWGDTISVTLTNKLTTNGTGIHWHGIRQLNTGDQDGVPGITECPLAPGQSKTYTWLATQFGTTWFHSHFSAQYGDGATGQIIIDGPASSNYDIDLGAMPLTDWYYQDSWVVGLQAHASLQAFAAPPPADTILINGTNMSPNNQTGAYSKTTGLVAGKKYRLRLINISVDNPLRVSLDGHPFTVITSDLVPIKPWTTNWILIAIGQRYDVIFTATAANAKVGNFWLRVHYAAQCLSSGNNNPNALGIFSYANAPSGNPASTAYTEPADCIEPLSNLVPWVSNTVNSTAFLNQVGNLEVDISVPGLDGNGQNIVIWGVNLSAIDVNWDKPTTQYVKDGNTSYPTNLNLIELPTEGIWSYWIIQEPSNSPVPIPHPIHLHGHDFYVLGTGSGIFDKNTSPSTLKYTNPPRRDTAFLPGGGWLALAFPTDNPGAWLMHCHIAWHVSDGLAVQFLEGKSSSKFPLGDSSWDANCKSWNTFDATMPFPKTDSGLKLVKDSVN